MSPPRGPGAERGDRAERLYEEARARPAAERIAFIHEQCRDDEGLRSELLELLAHADDAERFFALLADVVDTAQLTTSPIAGRYEILGVIGTGGMGVVYRARDTRLERDVALKFLPPYFAPAGDAEERLLREARAAAALEHANVCTVHEIGVTEDGQPFISMSYYEGQTLKQRLRDGTIPVTEAITIATQIARGLAAAHARGIVHRDVKPGNVMLLRDGTVKLLDFGLARSIDASATTPDVTPGTVAYMSPEQARGDVVGPRSDLFGLGVVLHEMITGVHPFRGGNQHAVIHAILHEPPEPLHERAPGVPASLERLLSRLLQKDPRARYSSAEALLADLDLVTTHTGATTRVSRERTTSRALVMAVGGLIVVALAATMWLTLWGGNRTPARTAATATGAPARDAASAKTVAVLPFRNSSRNPDDDYLADGLTEELIAALSKVQALRVVARTSAYAFKGTDRDIREIGRVLNVGAILEGSVQNVGGHFRVRAQLVNVADGLHIWSDTYDREMTDIFTIQRDLALHIAAALEAELTPAERERVVQRPTADPIAYTLYLKGRHFWNQRTPAAFVRAREYFERAIEADSSYAAAHAGLAAVYSLQGLRSQLRPEVARARMRAAALKAVELDDELADAHAVLGAYLHVYEWDSEAAEREQLRAIELDPRYPVARSYYGNLLRSNGRNEEALAQYRAAVALDPLDPLANERLGQALVLAGRYDEARERLDDAIELDSMFWSPHSGLGMYYETLGQLDEALRAYRRADALAGSRNIAIGRVLARLGRTREARQILERLEEEAARTGLHDPDAATLLLALGDVEGALSWLQHAYRERHPGLRFIAGAPPFAPLEVEPRYLDLLRRIGLRR